MRHVKSELQEPPLTVNADECLLPVDYDDGVMHDALSSCSLESDELEDEGDHKLFLGCFVVSAMLAMLLPSLFQDQSSLYQSAIFNSSVSVDWQGFGTSLAWWAEFVGTLDPESHKQLLVQIFDQESNDSLRFNIVRYNLGGAQHTILENGTTPGTSFGTYKGIPSPQLPNGSFFWDVELPQVRVAQDCLLLGVNIVEAFVNSREFPATLAFIYVPRSLIS